MVMVYHFRIFDGRTDEVLIPLRKSPAERIKRVEGEIIEDTGEDVPVTSLDEHGRFDPTER